MSFRDQFAGPTGMLGHVAGCLMACRDLASWTVSLLQFQTDDAVLEIGVGRGEFFGQLMLPLLDQIARGDHQAALQARGSSAA